MNRLTTIQGCCIFEQDGCDKDCYNCNRLDIAFKKLSGYETTNLTPEEVIRLYNLSLEFSNDLANKATVEMPCKVGDTVYALSYADNKYYPRKVSAIKITSKSFVIEYREKGIVRSRKIGCGGVLLTKEEVEELI